MVRIFLTDLKSIAINPESISTPWMTDSRGSRGGARKRGTVASLQASRELRNPAQTAVNSASDKIRWDTAMRSRIHLHTITLWFTAALPTYTRGRSLPPSPLRLGVLWLLLRAALGAVPVVKAQRALVCFLRVFAAAALDSSSARTVLEPAAQGSARVVGPSPAQHPLLGVRRIHDG